MKPQQVWRMSKAAEKCWADAGLRASDSRLSVSFLSWRRVLELAADHRVLPW